MRTVLGFLRLPPSERRLALRGWRLLVVATLCVRVWPLKRLVLAIDERVARRGMRDGSPEDALRLLSSAGRRVWPRPTCLVAALAGYELLRERGCGVAFVIGGHTTGAGFQAHAWLERGDVVLIGAPTAPYQPIWRWPAGPVEVSPHLADGAPRSRVSVVP